MRRPGSNRHSIAIGIALLVPHACAVAAVESRAIAAIVPLGVETHARQVAPGEPLRIQVRATEPLVRASATFLGASIQLAPDASKLHWTGWALVGLDQASGPQVLEITGVTAADRPAAGSLALTIETREFPEERLSVEPRFVEPPPDVRARLDREREKLDAIYELRSPAPATDRPFVRPVPGEPTSVFGTRRVYNGVPRSPHPGLDLRAATGTAVRASGPGAVVLAQDLYYSGNTVILDHGGGLFTLYAHLSRIDVAPGQTVEPGKIVGLSGATGRVTGPHLHWGAKIGESPFDPTALLDPRLWRP